MLLDYENQMIIDMYNDSCLLVTGKGMGIDKIIYSFLKLYCIDSLLALVIDCSMEDAKYYVDKLITEGVPLNPSHITSDCLTKNHEKVYKRGGLIFVSSTILIVDYLTGRIPGSLVTGIVVFKGHKVSESCKEAFVLRLFKESSPTGFVKAFSESPLALSSGFSLLDKIMINLHVDKIYLWPRFSLNVVTTLNNTKPNIEEIMLQITDAGTLCQIALLDLIKDLLNDLKLDNSFIDSDEFTVENAITNSFDRLVQLYFDPFWSQISKKSRSLINEIKEMRRLTYLLIEQDPVSFFMVIDSMRSQAICDKCNWITLRPATTLFNGAKSRLFKNINIDWRKIVHAKELNVEVPPKWNAFIEILKRIEITPLECGPRKTLVIVSKEATALLLAKLSISSAKTVLDENLKNHLNIKTAKTKPGKAKKLVATTPSGNDDTLQGIIVCDRCIIVETANIVIHYLSEGSSQNYIASPKQKFNYLIRQYDPRNIILFDPRLNEVREIENFQCELLCSSSPAIINVYLMMYINSVEEQKYLTSLRKEKEAFEYLIKAKASLILPKRCYDFRPSVYGSSTRVGGSENIVPNIIVDIREFRSELPALLHKKGFTIVPLTISVGDYILAPHICVERKSVSDFIGSLNNGRLYSQCASMSRNYALSILLIEFSSSTSMRNYNKNTFSLYIGNSKSSNHVNINDVQSKLTLLTIHFPNLRILWSHDPYATVELFKDLKLGRPEPSKDKLPNSDGSSYTGDNQYNEDIVDILLKIPGITWKNHGMFLRRIKNLLDLLNFTEQDIAGIIENKLLAQKIYSFLHSSKQNLFLSKSKESGPVFKKPRFDLIKKYKK